MLATVSLRSIVYLRLLCTNRKTKMYTIASIFFLWFYVDLYQDTRIKGRTKIVDECEQCAKTNI